MKITKLEIAGIHNVDKQVYEFQNINYFRGRNGVGKTTILQAIQLAILGYIPGTAKKASSIFKHSNSPSMSVVLHIDDDGQEFTVTRIFSGNSSNVKIDPPNYLLEDIVSDIELPIFNFNEFTNMTANKMKDWFINFLPNADVDIDFRKEFTEDLRRSSIDISESSILDDCVEYIDNLSETGLDKIRKANEYLKILVSEKKSEVSRHESTIQSLVYYEDDDLQMYDRDELMAQLKDIEDIISKKAGYEQFIQYQNIMCSSKFDHLADDIMHDVQYMQLSTSLKKKLEDEGELRNQVASIRGKLSRLENRKSQLEAIKNYKDICPYTSKICVEIGTMSDDAEKQITKIDDEIDILYIEQQTIDDKANELRNDIGVDREKIQNIMDQYKERDRMKADMQKQSSIDQIAPDDTRSMQELEVEKEALTDKISRLRANEQYDKMYDKIVSAKYKTESELEALKSWEKLTGVNGLQTSDRVNKPFVDLKTSIDEYLFKFFGPDTESKFDLIGKANSFSFGIERGGKYIPFSMLSSGEKCMYALALMIAIVKSSKSQLKVIMMDDMFDHLDDNNIEIVFATIQNCTDIQMIFAGVKDVRSNINCIELRR